jgi:hypothetical protein
MKHPQKSTIIVIKNAFSPIICGRVWRPPTKTTAGAHRNAQTGKLTILIPREIASSIVTVDIALGKHFGLVKAPRGEWRFVGDADCFDELRLWQILSEVIASPMVYVAVSRHDAQLVAQDVVCSLACKYLCQGDVRIADAMLRNFVELSRVGAACLEK